MIFPFYLIININQKYNTNINNITLEYKNEYHAHNIFSQHVGLHAKVIWLTVFSLNSKCLHTTFAGWLTGRHYMSVHEIIIG